MQFLSPAQKSTILTMLDADQSASSISASTGVHLSTISRHRFKEHSELQKSTEGCSKKLFPSNICHAIHLISTQRAENAVQVTKTLFNIINQPLSPSITCLYLKKAGMKAVVKTKHPLLSAKHQKARLDFAPMHTRIGPWMTERGWYGLMRSRSIA